MKENCSPSLSQPKKQVRFNTSLRMASPLDHQLPRPLTDIQNTNTERRHDVQIQERRKTCEPTFSSNVFTKNQQSPRAYFDTDCVINLPSKKFDPKSKLNDVPLPKPCDDLELSILDSSDVFKGNGCGNNDKLNGSRKLYENDTPYCFSPSKMPLHSVYNQTQSEKLFNLTPGLMTSAAQSKKVFHMEKPDSDPGQGFFTLPNSAGLYRDKKSIAKLSDNVATAKNNLMIQKTNNCEPDFCNKRDFNVDSHSSAALRQFGADKRNVGFMYQAHNGFNPQEQNANGFNPHGQNANVFNPQEQNANGFNPQGQNANGFNPQGQNANGFNPQGQNANGFNPRGQNANGFSSQGQNTNGFGCERLNAKGFGYHGQNPNGFRSERQHPNGFSSQKQNTNGFASDRINGNGNHPQGQNSNRLNLQGQNVHELSLDKQNAQVFSSNSHQPKTHGGQVQYNLNKMICQKEYGQTYEECSHNDYCCPRNVTRHTCYNQRDCRPHYEETIVNNTEIITNGLEMKQKAIEAREKLTNGGQNILKEMDKCNNDIENIIVCSKNTNEPTVSDLYKIIKSQNKQLQMLQNRVNRLLTVNEPKIKDCELPDSRNEQVLTNGQSDRNLPQANVNCIEHISIGVMTSFELVMSSNYVNKRNVTFNSEAINNNHRDECVQTTPPNSNSVLLQHNHDNCGEKSVQTMQNFNSLLRNEGVRSESSPIAESGGNFLDGIARCNKTCDLDGSTPKNPKKLDEERQIGVIDNTMQYDGQVTPKMNDLQRKARARVQRSDASPIAEYNEECFDETEPNECSQPNIGWTFYNNVMKRVNNMLSPPNANSASPNVAPRRQITTEQSQQLATTQRVTCDTQLLETPQQFCRPSSELSLHMTQLAAKYNVASKTFSAVPASVQPPAFVNSNRLALPNVCHTFGDARNEMSFATMQYMQRYQLLSVMNEQPLVAADRGNVNYANHRSRTHLNPVYNNPSRILDITTLKQQSKLL